ncbi:MAG: hypothetical protein ACK55Z_28235, partial [bacterium]
CVCKSSTRTVLACTPNTSTCPVTQWCSPHNSLPICDASCGFDATRAVDVPASIMHDRDLSFTPDVEVGSTTSQKTAAGTDWPGVSVALPSDSIGRSFSDWILVSAAANS